jgi:hypothetical protein
MIFFFFLFKLLIFSLCTREYYLEIILWFNLISYFFLPLWQVIIKDLQWWHLHNITPLHRLGESLVSLRDGNFFENLNILPGLYELQKNKWNYLRFICLALGSCSVYIFLGFLKRLHLLSQPCSFVQLLPCWRVLLRPLLLLFLTERAAMLLLRIVIAMW